MRRAIASVVLVALLLLAVTPAHAGRSTDIALGLASFAVFNQVVGPFLRPRAAEASYHRREVVHQTIVTQPAVVYATPAPVVYATPAPVVVATAPVVSYPSVVHYPHGRYELRWNGAQYMWVWIPNVPPVPPPPPATAPAPPPAAP